MRAHDLRRRIDEAQPQSLVFAKGNIDRRLAVDVETSGWSTCGLRSPPAPDASAVRPPCRGQSANTRTSSRSIGGDAGSSTISAP